MIPLTILAALAVVFLAWLIVATLSWALIHGAKLIERRSRG